MSFTPDVPSTEEVLAAVLSSSLPSLPAQEQLVGDTLVSWWETNPGEVYIHTEGGTPDNRHYASRLCSLELEAHGYRRAQFDMDRASSDELAWGPVRREQPSKAAFVPPTADETLPLEEVMARYAPVEARSWDDARGLFEDRYGEYLQALREDLTKNGMLNPIQLDRERKVVGDGHTRLLAARDIGLTHVPVIYRTWQHYYPDTDDWVWDHRAREHVYDPPDEPIDEHPESRRTSSRPARMADMSDSSPERPYYLEPGVSPEIAQFIAEQWPDVSAAYSSDPLNCTMGSRAWQAAFRQAGIPYQHINNGEFLHPTGTAFHQYLLVGDKEHIFDPTAAQWPISASPELYTVEAGDTDDEPGWSVLDYWNENGLLHDHGYEEAGD